MPKTRASWGSNSPAARKGYRTLRYWADKHDGRGYRRCCKTIKGSKRDGDAELARLRIMHDGDKPTPTLRQAYELWFIPECESKLAEYERAGKPGKKGTTLKPASFCQIESAWRVHVEPRWGDTIVTDIIYTDVQEWLDTKTEQVAQRCISLLKSVLRLCMFNGVIKSNVAEFSYRMPTKAAKYDDGTWSFDVLANTMWRDMYGRLGEAAFIMYAFDGCRSGEGLAPRLDEVQRAERDGMEFAIVPIMRQVSDSGKVSLDSDLKNVWSPRVTVLPPPFSTRILELTNEGMERGEIWLSDNGACEPLSQHIIRREFYAMQDRCGIDRKQMRALRRSWRSWVSTLGISSEIIEKMFGHVGKGTTGRHYLKLNSDMLVDEFSRVLKQNPINVDWYPLGKNREKF